MVDLGLRGSNENASEVTTVWRYINSIIIIILFKTTDCNKLAGGERVLKWDRIPPLHCHGQLLEQ